MNRRIVFDTSTLIGAALRRGSIPHRALQLALAENEVCVSAELMSEPERVLLSKKFERYLPHFERVQFVEYLQRRTQTQILQVEMWSSLEPRCRDRNDDYLLLLARSVGADTIVTSDEDLRVLTPWNNVTILRPSEFLEREFRHPNRESTPKDVS